MSRPDAWMPSPAAPPAAPPAFPLLPLLALPVLLAAALAPAPAAQTVLHTFDGSQANAASGASVALAGDVDADGFVDVLVAEPDYDRLVLPSTLLVNAGRVRVHSGRTGALLATHFGTESGARCGASVAGFGDVDGDGRADYALGSPGEGIGGAVRVYKGSTHAFHWLDDQTGSPGTGDQLGASMCFADVRNGPRTELLYGAPGFDSFAPGGVDAGIVYCMDFEASLDGFLDSNAQAGARFGSSIANVGDWNGDGYDDVAVGAPGFDFGLPPLVAQDAGRVAVLSRSGPGSWTTLYQLNGGFNSGREFGASVAGVADANLDGWPELVVGGPGDDSLGPDTGMSQLIFGPAGATSHTRFGLAAGDRFGERVAGLGDWDGDGRGDYAVSAPFHDTGVSPLLIPEGGRVEVRRGLSGGLLIAFEGLDPAGHLGAGLAGGGVVPGAGDVNGDGFDDVAMGAPQHDQGGPEIGRTLVRTGPDLSADWSNVGAGTPGGGGVPFLQMGSDPVLGQTTSIVMDSVSTGPVVAWIHLGFVQASLPVKGGMLHLNPVNSLPVALPLGPVVFALPVPNDALLPLGPPLLLQLTVPDPFAPQGWAFSKLLVIEFGY